VAGDLGIASAQRGQQNEGLRNARMTHRRTSCSTASTTAQERARLTVPSGSCGSV
jgi:hypothetical protein